MPRGWRSPASLTRHQHRLCICRRETRNERRSGPNKVPVCPRSDKYPRTIVFPGPCQSRPVGWFEVASHSPQRSTHSLPHLKTTHHRVDPCSPCRIGSYKTCASPQPPFFTLTTSLRCCCLPLPRPQSIPSTREDLRRRRFLPSTTHSVHPNRVSHRIVDSTKPPTMASPSTAVQAEAFPDGTKDYVPLRKRNYDIKKPRKPPQLVPGSPGRRWLTQTPYRHYRPAHHTEELVPTCQLAQHILHYRHSSVRVDLHLLGFPSLGDGRLRGCLLLLRRPRNHRRLPPSLGAHQLQSHTSPSHLPGRRRLGCR